MRAPWAGGLDQVIRTIFSIWERTRRMLSGSFATTVRFPTRSSRERGENQPWPPWRGWGVGLWLRGALTVESEVLGEGLGTEELESFRHKVADGPGVLLQAPRCKALVGRVKEGEQKPALQGRTDIRAGNSSRTNLRNQLSFSNQCLKTVHFTYFSPFCLQQLLFICFSVQLSTSQQS